jgi:hypothetical protein
VDEAKFKGVNRYGKFFLYLKINIKWELYGQKLHHCSGYNCKQSGSRKNQRSTSKRENNRMRKHNQPSHIFFQLARQAGQVRRMLSDYEVSQGFVCRVGGAGEGVTQL